MTIKFKTGNILDSEENLIIQSVNYCKVMGGGLSLISGIYALWLFSDNYKYMFKISENNK